MLFEQTMWRGLASRLVRLGLPPYFAMQIAAACYPNGAKKAMQGSGFVFAPPIVSPQQAALAVSRFEAAGAKGAPDLFVPLLVVLFGQNRFEQWREELLEADAEAAAAADAKGRHLEAQYEAALRELGLPLTASLAEVQQQYRSLCKQLHPDRHQHESEEIQAKYHGQMARINKAYEVVVAWLELAKTAPPGRRSSKADKNAKTAPGAGPTSTPRPQQTNPLGKESPERTARPLIAFALLGLLALCVAGLIGVAVIQEHKKQTTSKPQSVSAHQIAQLRRQLQNLDTQIRSAESELVALRSKRATAVQAAAELTEELELLRVRMPAIEAELDRVNEKKEASSAESVGEVGFG